MNGFSRIIEQELDVIGKSEHHRLEHDPDVIALVLYHLCPPGVPQHTKQSRPGHGEVPIVAQWFNIVIGADVS